MLRQPPEKVYWIIWAALFSAIAVYALLAFSGVAGTPESSDASQIEILAKILGGIAALNLLIAFSVRRWVSNRDAIAEEVSLSRSSFSSFAAHMVSWALTESVALFGLILALRERPGNGGSCSWRVRPLPCSSFAPICQKIGRFPR
ncbi:MAG: hypothetical protein R3F31_08950 [Verrucomicrobiales bacterium]